MERIDFSNCRLNGKNYGGSERKLGIIYHSKNYMLKFRKKTHLSLQNNDISEYLGSHIYQMIGLSCQDTILGTYNGEKVVACLDFLEEDSRFMAFNALGESTIDTDMDHHKYTYEEIENLIRSNKKLVDPGSCSRAFFDMYIVDALIGNFDRHGGNWGFIKKDGRYTLSPVFDNGSCLFPNIIDENEMESIMNDPEQIDMRVYTFPTSQILLNGRKSSYFEVISSLSMDGVNEALLRVFPSIDIDEIVVFISSLDVISKTQREFYITMLKARYEKILEHSYSKMMEGKR